MIALRICEFRFNVVQLLEGWFKGPPQTADMENKLDVLFVSLEHRLVNSVYSEKRHFVRTTEEED